MAQGRTVGKICRGLGVFEASFYRWRSEYGGLKVDHALIELPTDTAPKLDKDVVILPSRRHPKAVLAQPEQAAQAAAVADGSDIVIRPSRSGTGTPAPTSPAATVSNSGTRSSGTQTAKPATGSRTGSGKTPATKPSLTPEARAVLQDPRVKAGTARTNASITPDINVYANWGRTFQVLTGSTAPAYMTVGQASYKPSINTG